MNKCKWEENEFVGCKHSQEPWDEGESLQSLVNRGSMLYYFLFCPFCGASLEKPVKIEVGMFGRFNDGTYGVLTAINKDHQNPYISSNFSMHRGFTPGLPKGFKEDGTPND